MASVTVHGPCRVASKSAQVYDFVGDGEGVCQIRVSFQSGAPDFTSDVRLVKTTADCCPGLHFTKHEVVVPEGGPVDAATDDAEIPED